MRRFANAPGMFVLYLNQLISIFIRCCILSLFFLKQIIPKLQDIVIGCEWTVDVRNGFYTIWRSPNFVPKCISSRLRYCTLTYEGMEDSLRFAEYVLQNARLLQVMTVKTTMFTRSVYHQKILDELNSCPKISPFCKLSIEL